MMRSMSALAMAFLTGAVQAGDPALKARQDPKEYATAMKEVAKKFKGTPGVYLQIGDQLIYTNQSCRWALGGSGHTEEEKAFLKWSHAGEHDEKDGWWLAIVDRPTDRSETAAGHITAADLLKGGFNELPSLAQILKKFNPQMALYMIGGNNIVWNDDPVPADTYIPDVEKAMDLMTAHGTIPILCTLPSFPDKVEIVESYNKSLRQLAKKKKIPLLDLHGEMKARAGDKIHERYVLPDRKHLTVDACDGPSTEENLNTCGYLLRCYTAVHKGMEVKAAVLDLIK